MGHKRKRNLKIDNSAQYAVHFIKDLNDEYLENYIEVCDSGMEADEEKESQLQNIIRQKDRSIPLPVIKTINNEARKMYGYKCLKKRIKWHSDCLNEYIEDYHAIEALINSENDGETNCGDELSVKKTKGVVKYEMLEKNDVFSKTVKYCDKLYIRINDIELLKNMFNNLENNNVILPSDNPIYRSFVYERILRRFEKSDNEPYVCFRKRIFHPTFKSRRNESVVLEKLERMKGEFLLLKNLCLTLEEKCNKEYEYLKITRKLLKACNFKDLTRKQRRFYRKRMAGDLQENLTFGSNFNLFSLMFDRNKIEMLKNANNVLSEPFIDSKHAKSMLELVNFTNIKKNTNFIEKENLLDKKEFNNKNQFFD